VVVLWELLGEVFIDCIDGLLFMKVVFVPYFIGGLLYAQSYLCVTKRYNVIAISGLIWGMK
jgi:hypothetical protein